MENTLIIIDGLLILLVFFLLFYLSLKNKTIKENKSKISILNGERNQQSLAILNKDNTIKRQEERINRLRSKLDKINQKSAQGKPIPVSMYRLVTKDDKPIEQGMDYIYLGTYASYRQAESMTGVKRAKIRQSMRFDKLVYSPKKEVKVIFVPEDNDLKSNEKIRY